MIDLESEEEGLPHRSKKASSSTDRQANAGVPSISQAVLPSNYTPAYTAATSSPKASAAAPSGKRRQLPGSLSQMPSTGGSRKGRGAQNEDWD